jgi:hypothetical protein
MFCDRQAAGVPSFKAALHMGCRATIEDVRAKALDPVVKGVGGGASTLATRGHEILKTPVTVILWLG